MNTQALISFCKILGIEESSLPADERPGLFFLTRQLPASRFAGLLPAHVAELVDTYGSILTLSVGIDHPFAVLDLDVAEGQSSTPLPEAVAAIQRHDDSQQLLLELRLDKGPILEKLGLPGQLFDSHFFFFTTSLARWLSTPLPRLEKELYTSPHEPVVILLSEPGILVRGPFLNVASLDRLQFIVEDPPEPTDDQKKAVDQYLALAKEHLNLRDFSLAMLTPYHFLTHSSTALRPPLKGPLVDNLIHLAIIYTATRASADHGQLTATYASAERPVTLNLDRGVNIPGYLDFVPRLARWPLGEASREKLAILQSVVSRELQDDPPTKAYERFVIKLKDILDQADWHLRVYLDGQIDKHFEQVEKATDFVAGTAKEVSDSVDGLAKALTESLLGAVGLIAITMIATVLKDTVDINLIKIALMVYAAYLFIFQFLYRMGTTLYSYILLHRESKKRQAAYREVLLEKVDDLFQPLRPRNTQFLIIFIVTAILFLCVAIGLGLAALNLTAILEYFGVALSAPTSTPSPTPMPSATPISHVTYLHLPTG